MHSVSKLEDNVYQCVLEFILYCGLTGLNIIGFSSPMVASQFVPLDVHKEKMLLLLIEVLIVLVVRFLL